MPINTDRLSKSLKRLSSLHLSESIRSIQSKSSIPTLTTSKDTIIERIGEGVVKCKMVIPRDFTKVLLNWKRLEEGKCRASRRLGSLKIRMTFDRPKNERGVPISTQIYK